MNTLTLESPAKINLMLSVHGRRDDGFHALTSLVAALAFGDTLRVSSNGGGIDRLSCSDPAVPTGEGNLILRAAQAFRAQAGSHACFDFDLEKRIPMGAGLGGGSSNAAVALCAMNQLAGHPLSKQKLLDVAASLGSDCPFFVDAVPALMAGRGERLTPLADDIAAGLRGRRIILFRPEFGIETAWAYRRLMEASPSAYESEVAARERFHTFSHTGRLEDALFNCFEPAVGTKYLAIPCLLEQLRRADHACLMSGSGSCCFALALDSAEIDAIRRICEAAWGSGIFFIETSIR